MKKALNQAIFSLVIGLITIKVVSLVLFSFPTPAEASFFSFIGDLFGKAGMAEVVDAVSDSNSQKMDLLQAPTAPNLNPAQGGGDIAVVGGTALLSESGPAGGAADTWNEGGLNGQISIYSVHKGDTLSQIASMFGVSVNTILWANDLKTRTLSEGQQLVILPVSGVKYTVKKGDTLKGIAASLKADVGEIAQYNNIGTGSVLAIGDVLIIPDGDGGSLQSPVIPKAPVSKWAAPNETDSSHLVASLKNKVLPKYSGYYGAPLDACSPTSYGLCGNIKTQGLHGWNGVDLSFADALGTPIHAVADGVVIVSRNGGWNGGYGNYVVISHANGTQTLYAHMISTAISEGATIKKGQTIGFLGTTGKSTGPHLHIEVRGAANPF